MKDFDVGREFKFTIDERTAKTFRHFDVEEKNRIHFPTFLDQTITLLFVILIAQF